jgi:hypothetical protein
LRMGIRISCVARGISIVPWVHPRKNPLQWPTVIMLVWRMRAKSRQLKGSLNLELECFLWFGESIPLLIEEKWG